MNTWAAVPSVMLREQATAFRAQRPVLFRVGALAASAPGIEAGGRHVKVPAQRAHARLGVVRLDEGEDVACRAEQNRMAFFRRSCSCCNAAYFRSTS